MRPVHHLTIGAISAILAAGPAAGQCTTIDFDNYSVGTIITTQYDGVTFSADPDSCGPGTIDVWIVQPNGGTSSGSRALGIMPGCDFSPDFIRMVFDEPQRAVSFTVGDETTPGLTFDLRAYRSNGSLIGGTSLTVGTGVYRLVEIGSPGGPAEIARVEVQSFVGTFECIDDLSFNADATPPTARIDSPTHGGCLCGPTITVTGVACDEDGDYGGDMLEYRAVGAAPGTPWTFIDDAITPVCNPGFLYTWPVSGVSHGWYYLRMTVTNACGASSTDIVSVLVDKVFGTVQVDSPAEQEEVCGVVTMEGTIDDHCGSCFVEYTVKYAQAGHPEALVPVDPSHPVYTEPVRNGALAVWDTIALGVPTGGIYMLRFEGIDECGNVKTKDRLVLLEACTDCPEDLDESGAIDFGDLLRILSFWGPCP